MEVAVQPREDARRSLVGILVAQPLDLAVDARDAHRAREPVPGHIDEREVEPLLVVDPHVDEVAADVGRRSVSEVEAHPARVERLGEQRLVHRARLQELPPHLHEAAPDEAGLEAVLVPAQARVAQHQRGHEQQRREADRESRRDPRAVARREPRAQQHPAQEERHDRLERLAPVPRQEQRRREVPEEDREERRRRRLRVHEQHARLEPEVEEAEREDHPRRGGHEFRARVQLRTDLQSVPRDHAEARQRQQRPHPPRHVQHLGRVDGVPAARALANRAVGALRGNGFVDAFRDIVDRELSVGCSAGLLGRGFRRDLRRAIRRRVLRRVRSAALRTVRRCRVARTSIRRASAIGDREDVVLPPAVHDAADRRGGRGAGASARTVLAPRRADAGLDDFLRRILRQRLEQQSAADHRRRSHELEDRVRDAQPAEPPPQPLSELALVLGAEHPAVALEFGGFALCLCHGAPS